MRVEDKSEFYGPWRSLLCPRCGYEHIHQCSDALKPGRTWLRVVLQNWWENGWRIEVRHGYTHPIGYGASWQMVHKMAIVMHPMPLNVVMRHGYELTMWMHRGGWRRYPSKQDEINHAVAQRLEWMERKRQL